MPASDTVDTPSIAWREMNKSWTLIHDLLGGTRAMRDAGETWLPRETKEEARDYSARLARSILFEAYRDTVKRLVSKPFSKPMTFDGGDLPVELQTVIDDVDAQGQTLAQLARDAFEDAINHGLVHFLIDFSNTGGAQTAEDEQRGVARPIISRVSAPALIGWTSEVIDGERRLTSIRIKECVTRVATGSKYTEESVEQVRLITPTEWVLFEHKKLQTDKSEWVEVQRGVNSFGAIPLVTFYVERTGFLTAVPPLEPLAWLNLAHWQSFSDQRNILRYARSGILFGKGFAKGALSSVIIGPNSVVSTENPEATLGFVEIRGEALQAGADDIKQLEDKMEALGMQPFMERTANTTATAKILSDKDSTSDIQAWILELERTLLRTLEFAAQWLKKTVPESFKIDIFNDFSVTVRGATDLSILQTARLAGDLSRETFLRECKRRGVLMENLDIEQETGRLDEEIRPSADNSE